MMYLKFWMSIVLLISVSYAYAFDFKVDNIFYDVISLDDMTCKVVQGNEDYKGDIKIPAKVCVNDRTLTVTEIDGAFYWDKELVSVVIPETVLKIGEYSFFSCESLKSVIMPNSIIEIGEYAFEQCYALEQVVIPEFITEIKNGTFYACTSLKEIIIPNSVTYIGWDAFCYCTSLETVLLGNALKCIDVRAFEGCNSIINIDIPDSVEEIGAYSFRGCTSLENIKLSHQIKRLNYGTFSQCNSLKSLTLPGNINEIIQYYKTKDGRKMSYVFELCLNLESLVLESGDILRGLYDDQDNNLYETDIWWGYGITDSVNLYDLPIKSITIDRSLSNTLSLPELENLILGSNVENVQIDPAVSFYLQNIKCYSLVPPSAPEFTQSQYIHAIVNVPREALEAYKEHPIWKKFWNLKGDPSITTVAEDIIMENGSKTEVGRYDLNGRSVGENYEGIVIIRYSDGSVKKVAIRK